MQRETPITGPAAIDPAAIDPAAIDPAAIDPAAIDPAASLRLKTNGGSPARQADSPREAGNKKSKYLN